MSVTLKRPPPPLRSLSKTRPPPHLQPIPRPHPASANRKRFFAFIIIIIINKYFYTGQNHSKCCEIILCTILTKFCSSMGPVIRETKIKMNQKLLKVEN